MNSRLFVSIFLLELALTNRSLPVLETLETQPAPPIPVLYIPRIPRVPSMIYHPRQPIFKAFLGRPTPG